MIPNIHHKLTHAVTEYDRRQSKRKHYNIYALGHYLGRVAEILDDIERGADPRAAIIVAFSGRLLDFVLKSVGLPESTKEECQGGSIVYKPVTEGKVSHASVKANLFKQTLAKGARES